MCNRMGKTLIYEKIVFLVFVILLITGIKPVFAEEIQQISPQEVKKMIESKQTNFLIVDAQPQEVYNFEHIKGAVSFPIDDDNKNPSKLPKNKLLIIYCDCAHEEDAITTANELKGKWGFTKVRTLKGGWSGWQKLGYPTEKPVKK